jgi:hypothetical protein
VPATPAGPPPSRGDLTDALIHSDVWSDQMVFDAGIPVDDVALVTIGGGIGSFVLCDYLLIGGVAPDQVRVLGSSETPWETYEYLTRVSQIPHRERLRSDAGSTPDSIWGFPSYALREAFSARKPSAFVAPLFQVATEPILTDYYTPRAGQVFAGLKREAERIRYWDLTVRGQVRMVRRRHGGGYFTILTPADRNAQTKRVAYRSRFVHVAVGYPGLRFLPDLQEYRQRHRDFARVVNAYEPHEHVYEELLRKPGSTVLVRGAGIVASRILQRLVDEVDHNGAELRIAHLFRTYVDKSHGPNPWMRRKGRDGWAYQGFNWPKGAWGGQLKYRLEKLEGKDRAALISVMGGTNTPRRKLWLDQLARGRREGFYRELVGTVDCVTPGPKGTIVTKIKTDDGVLQLEANFIIDATGLEADIAEHRVLKDLLDHSGAGRNPVGRLDVDRSFEVRGTRNGVGRMYASGSATLGGYYVGVDSFLGLQYAAVTIMDDLARQRFCKKIGPIRSIAQWWRWMLNMAP